MTDFSDRWIEGWRRRRRLLGGTRGAARRSQLPTEHPERDAAAAQLFAIAMYRPCAATVAGRGAKSCRARSHGRPTCASGAPAVALSRHDLRLDGYAELLATQLAHGIAAWRSRRLRRLRRPIPCCRRTSAALDREDPTVGSQLVTDGRRGEGAARGPIGGLSRRP